MKKMTHKRWNSHYLEVSKYKIKLLALIVMSPYLGVNALNDEKDINASATNNLEINYANDFSRKESVINEKNLLDNNDNLDIIPVSISQMEVVGTVTDASGMPLPGTNVLEKGTTNGAQTDFDGNFKLSVSDNGILVFSYLGYITKEVPVNGQSKLTVVLDEDVSSLDEVVLVGYGTQKKATLTSAVTSVNPAELQAIPSAQLSNNLAGRLPGVQIVGSSGLVGASSSISVRGTGIDALYVIDNVVSDKSQFDVLDPNEVENITVLKDAAAASIYGARASGGVVLVTTKKGKSGKVTFNYSTIYSTNSLTKPLQNYTAEQEIIYYNDLAINRNEINPDPNFQVPYGADVLEFAKGVNYRTVNDEIWQSPTSQQHNLSVSGGSDKINYFFSTGLNKSQGSYKNTDFNRYNIRARVDAKITDNIKLTTNLSGNKRDTKRFYWPYDGDDGEGFTVADFYRSTFNLSRLYPFYSRLDGTPTTGSDPEGYAVIQPGWGFNPAEAVNGDGYRKIGYNTFNGIMELDINIPKIEGLSFNVRGNYRQDVKNVKNFVLHNKSLRVQTVGAPGSGGVDQFTLAPLVTDGTQDVVNNLGWPYEGIEERMNLTETTQLNGLVRYERTFGDHNLNAFLGFEQAQTSFKGIYGTATDLLSTGVDQIISASESSDKRTFGGNEYKTARLSYLGRATYSYLNKYILEFSFRNDGSYIFPKGERFGFFPSVSGAWRISDEDFFKSDVINNLKLRGSFGQTGNDGVAPFQFQNNFVRGTSYVFESGLNDGLTTQSTIPNPFITWEKHSTWNAGFDLGMFSNKLNATVDVFRNNITDILAPTTVTVPGTFGSDLPSTNVGEKVIRGFEVAVDYRNTKGDFSYSLGANIGYAKDEWVSYPEAEGIPDFQSRIGKSSDRYIGYVSEGIIRDQATLDALPAGFTQFGRTPQLGEILFKDIRGTNYSDGPDGVVDQNDRDILSDNTIPRINYGITGDFKWKGFSVQMFFQGVAAYDRFVRTLNTSNNLGPYNEGGVFQIGRPYFELWTDAWSFDNPNGKYPRVENNWDHVENGHGPSTFWKRNGAYLRLKNLNIAYALPETLLEKVGIERMSVFLNGTNLFVISGFDEYDPEQETLDSYPIFKTYSVGLNVSF